MMEDEHHCCQARISGLMSRVCRMEMMLEKVLGQMEIEAKQQPLYSTYSDSSSVPPSQMETFVLGQPGSASSITLHEAAERRDTVALVRGLARGADPNAMNISGDTALHCAARSGDALAAELLLACGAIVDARGNGGFSPLTVAVCEGHTNFVQVLLEKGANIELPDKIGQTPLMLAIASKNMEIVNLLGKNCKPSGVVESPLFTASRFCLIDNLKKLINFFKPSNQQMLDAILIAGSLDVAIILLANTHKDVICSTNFCLLPQFAKEGWAQPIAINLKICANCRSEECTENLQQAIAISSSEDILFMLWKHQQTSTRAIAMERCAAMKWIIALEHILMHWRRDNDQPNDEFTEALRAANSPRIVILFLKACPKVMHTAVGHEVYWRSVELGWFVVLENLLKEKFPVDIVRSDGSSALHCAAAGGRANCIQLLINHGASVNITNDDGWTPLHVAAEGGYKYAVQVLLSAGANPKAKDQCGIMPSNIAGSVEVLALLLRC